mmetsp:Transcript_104705/g.208027  ORF Transcript_104705/g.208027 Transcript_104705/m.208027 type:complete len:240 (-) Transcript_104705:99-818(-)|eukprot:CAMPEP_0172715374 /NCGR_PEP_ID=MMETSP1074-20121228/67507_1 /TAXON_ID=2916 /ORGANISM="Ceratium fusus, Strain PA161109" /LENGTH=239 /DNA_ID=CAMNT_0013539947 /DNA_START=110 /DNA_END=829 /DNA_ORIENTATION=-
MPDASKKALRRQQSRAEKREFFEQEEEQKTTAVPTGGALLDLVQCLVKESCLVTHGRNLVDGGKEGVRDILKHEEDPKESIDIFHGLKERLHWHNSLGLGSQTGVDAKQDWHAMWKREVDWGPRKSKRGTPGMDRILQNIHVGLSQYIHLLLALMLVRSLGSWGLLAWVFALQLASILVPIEMLPKVPPKARYVSSMVLHGLVWLLFLRDLVWSSYFFEKIFLVSLVLSHAYVTKPAGS